MDLNVKQFNPIKDLKERIEEYLHDLRYTKFSKLLNMKYKGQS